MTEQEEKLATLGKLSAAIVHELRNPLNFITNFAKLSNMIVKEKELNPQDIQDLKDNIFGIMHHAERANNVISNILAIAKGHTQEAVAIDINKILDLYLTLAWQGFKVQNPNFQINFDKSYATDMPCIMGYPGDLGRSFLNIIDNCLHALVKTAHPVLKIKSTYDATHITITIEDNGPGIDAELLKTLFDSFKKTRGLGLGMNLAHEIITKQHQGILDVTSILNHGTTFTIKLERNNG